MKSNLGRPAVLPVPILALAFAATLALPAVGAPPAEPSASPAGPAGPSDIKDLALDALQAHVAGRASDVDALAARLVDRAAAMPGEAESVAAALLLVDRSDAAVDVLRDAGRARQAFDLLAGELRLSEAMELQDGGVELAFARAHALGALGEREKAREALDALASSGETADVSRAIRELRSFGWDALAFGHAAAILEDASKGSRATALLSALFAGRATEARTAWTWLNRENPGLDPAEALGRVADMLDPAVASADIDAVLARAADDSMSLNSCDQKWMLDGLARIADLRGRRELALALTKNWAELTDAGAAWLSLGDRRFDGRDWAGAAEAYGRAAGTLPDDAGPAYLQAVALSRAGRTAEAAPLFQAARQRAGDDTARYRLAFTMERTGDLAAARQERERLLEAGAPESDIVVATSQLVARQAACARSHAEAVRLFDRAKRILLRSPQPLTLARVACIVRLSQAARLAAAIEGGRLDDALALSEHALEPLVANIDATADLVRALDAGGRISEADALFARVFDRVDLAAAGFPESPRLRNTLAWLGARSGRELDASEAAARQALALAPDSAAYLDTLAEVLFQQGDRDSAVAIAGHAAARDPTRPYYAAQLTRFATGSLDSRPLLD